MKIVALGRQEGKTTLCVDYLTQNPKVHMLVWHSATAKRIMEHWPAVKGRVHSIRCDMKKLAKKYDIEAYIIDGVDECMVELTGKVVRLVTFTQDSLDTYL